MGNRIIISGADYSENDIKAELLGTFDVLSDHINFLDYNTETNLLRASQNGASNNFETVGNTNIVSATIKIPVESTINISSVSFAILSGGNFATLYLNNSGQVRKFWKDGHNEPTILYGMPGSKPNVAEGSPFTITHSSDRVTISYSGYSNYILYSDIPGFESPVIGVLLTTNNLSNYNFVINN